MNAKRISIVCAALFGLLAAAYGLAVTDSAAEEPAYFHVLIAEDGEFTELSYEVNSSDLSMLFDGGVLALLLEGKHVLLSAEAASAFVDAETLEGQSEVFGMYSPIAATWGCIKCCFGDGNCCCPPEDPPDPKDPDGD